MFRRVYPFGMNDASRHYQAKREDALKHYQVRVDDDLYNFYQVSKAYSEKNCMDMKHHFLGLMIII